MTTAILVAKERQLDWLLEEALGATRGGARPAARERHRWLAAALVALAVGTAFGVAWLRRDGGDARKVQQPVQEGIWHEAHGAAGLDALPADVVSLRCFDFDDAAMAQLARFPKLERLDLSGMDVDERGVSRSLPITDAGVAHLGKLPNLRWLCLAQCHEMKGEALRELEALPLLEHLDLTYSGVESPAVERLARLGNLRELVLSHCMNFHGRSLAEVCKSPGLRRLELRACTTLSATDAMHLATMKGLRHLDLRDCQGRFRGQRMNAPSTNGEEPPPPPVEDDIGITDGVVAALAMLPLKTLLLGGSESLTDAIGESIAKMTTLRSLDLSNLPKTTGALLAKVPDGLESLGLDDNPQMGGGALRRLRRMPALRELGLVRLAFDATTLDAIAGGRLTTLRIGTASPRLRNFTEQIQAGESAQQVVRAVSAQHDLMNLSISDLWGDMRDVIAKIDIPVRLQTLDLTLAFAHLPYLSRLDEFRSLRVLRFIDCQQFDPALLDKLGGLPLRELSFQGTKVDPQRIREAAKAWPGCVIKMPDGQTWRAPGRQ